MSSRSTRDPKTSSTTTSPSCHGHDVADRFDDLVAEAEAAPVDGWDFSWLDGRASEQRPSWRYAHAMSERMARADVGLDIQTGGGEVLAEVPRLAARTAATESWPPNLARAAALLRPRGVPTSPSRSARRPSSSWPSSSSDLNLPRHAAAATRTTRRPPPKPPGRRSSTCGWSPYTPSSATSAQ